jgi:CRP-like cAMP-binding protein
MDIQSLLKNIEIFQGLTDEELAEIAAICKERLLQEGERFTTQGTPGDSVGIVKEGLLSITVTSAMAPTTQEIVHLGKGQVIGEMSLVDKGPRSATAEALSSPVNLLVIKHDDFHQLCKTNHRIGYIVFRNIAADLSFKLRHQTMSTSRSTHDHL